MVDCWELQLLPQSGLPPRGVPGNVWSYFSSVPPTTLTSMLRTSVSSIRPAINCIANSCLHFGSIFFHAPHPLFNVICHGGGPCYLHHSRRLPGPLALVLFSTTASAMAQHPSCTVFMVASTWVVLLAKLMGPIKLNPSSLAFPKGSPSLHDHHPKNRIASPGARTTALVIWCSRPSQSLSTIKEPLHAWEGGGWSPPSSPQVSLTWTQLHVWSSCVGWSC